MSGLFRFSEFELDLAAYALRRGSDRIKLEKIPMEVLILLVTRAGALVERSDIKAALWGDDVFVEHDSAISTAIRKVRLALDDAAETPRFVETVVGKGYRFIAPVEMRRAVSHAPHFSPRYCLMRSNEELDLIRFRGHLPKGGYDVRNGRDTKPASAPAVHG